MNDTKCMHMRVSIVVPTISCSYLEHLLSSLSKQTMKPWEVIIPIKGSNSRYVEELCAKNMLRCVVIEQSEGYFTHALNMGKREIIGDLVIFTDDDAMPPPSWIEKYVKLCYTLWDN